MNRRQRTRRQGITGLLLIFILVLVGLMFASSVLGAPAGASITFNSTDNGPTISPDSHTANRSTITTLVLNAIQQDSRWKAYVGNVTGTLTLDDSNNYTVYDWSSASISGEVYASRSTLDFSTVSCADAATITSEMTAMNMTGTEVDSIRKTFNSTNHTATVVAGTTLSGCNMTALYVNDATQTQNNASAFQEFLIEEAGNNMVYVSIINDNTVGFDNTSYDFQMIVAEEPTGAANLYYFYVELGT